MFKDHEIPVRIDVPVRAEIVNGREVTIAGADTTGDLPPALRGNSYGYGNTASLAAGALYLLGGVSEGDLVNRGVDLGICNRVQDAAFSGGVSQDDLSRLLSETDAPNQLERGYSLEDLAQNIESGSKVIAFVNAGELWDSVVDISRSEGDYSVLIEGVARDAQSQEITGFLVRDPAAPDRPAFVDAAKVTRSWLDAGGWQIVPSM
jgi:hypothetical protein